MAGIVWLVGRYKKKSIESLPDTGQASTDWVEVEYRGHWLVMRAHEKTEIWDRLNRSGKMKQIKATEDAVKQGIMVKIPVAGGGFRYQPKGKDLVKEAKIYNEEHEVQDIPTEFPDVNKLVVTGIFCIILVLIIMFVVCKIVLN